MRPYLCIIYLLILSTFLLSTRADTQDDEELSPESDTRIEWTDLLSLLNLTKIPKNVPAEAPFDVPQATNLGNDQHEGQESPSPELFQQHLEALLYEETGKFIRSFESLVNSSVSWGTMLQNVLEFAVSSDSVSPSIAPFTPLLRNIVRLTAIALDDIRARLPLPATAPGHAERVKRVSEVFERLQQLVVDLARDHNIEQEAIKRQLSHIKPFLQDTGVLVGDVAELYPGAVEALVLNLSAILMPEALFLRSLVILYCLGPYVLGKDAISGWLLKHVSESLRV